MSGRTESLTWDAVLTTTLANYQKKLEEQIFDDYPLLSWMNGKLGTAMRGSSVKRPLDGGESIVEHLLYEQNSTVDSYSNYEVLDVTPQDGMTTAKFNWKQYSGSVTISGLEERNNQGEAKMIDLLDAKIQQTRLSLSDRLSRDAYADGTGNGSKNLTGLAALVSTTATVGGLNPSTFTWWQADVTTSAGSFAATGKAKMETTFNNITFGNDKPDFIVTDQTVFESYNNSLVDQKRFNTDTGAFVNRIVADAGFTNITFKGVPVLFDRDCTAGYMYFLNSKYIKWNVHEDADFITTPFVKPENQDAKTANILYQGNMTTSNRRKLGVIQGFTA
jgi:hypothetical protein